MLVCSSPVLDLEKRILKSISSILEHPCSVSELSERLGCCELLTSVSHVLVQANVAWP